MTQGNEMSETLVMRTDWLRDLSYRKKTDKRDFFSTLEWQRGQVHCITNKQLIFASYTMNLTPFIFYLFWCRVLGLEPFIFANYLLV